MNASSYALSQALGLNAPQDPVRDKANAARAALDALMSGGTPLADVARTQPPVYAPRPEPMLGARRGPSGGMAGTIGRMVNKAAAGWASQVANQYGLRQTSGYRDPAHNARVGGVRNSYHTQRDAHGQSRAYDFVGSPAQMEAAKRAALANGAREAMVHKVPGGGVHLHIAY